MVALNCCRRNRLLGPYTQRNHGDVDGAYAWIVAMAAFFGHLLIYGVIFSSGVFYDMFREIFEGSSSVISLIATLSTAFTFGFSPIPGVLMNKYGQRAMTIIGGVVAGTGLVLSAYAPNVYYLAASFGVITGIGFGTAYLALVSIVPLFFTKYRSVAYGLVVSGVGLGTFVYPPVIRSLVHLFGARGALLITGGFTLNLCVCGALMRQPRTGVHSEKDDPPTSPRDSPQGSVNRNRCLAVFNLHIFANVSYLLLCVNNFFLLFGLSIVYVHLTAYSETKGAGKDSAAMLISAVGISNFFGRPCFGFLGKLRCGPLVLYVVSLSLCGLGVVIVPLVPDFVSLMISAACFGFLSASIGPLMPQIVTDFLSVDLLPSAYGYLLVFEGAGSLLGPPTAGWLLDTIKHYPPSFYLGGATVGLSGAMMIVPLLIRRPSTEVVLDEVIQGDNASTKEAFLSSKH